MLDVDLDFPIPRPKPAAFLPRFLIIFGLVSCSDQVTKLPMEMTWNFQLAGTSEPKSRIFSVTLFRLSAVFFSVCSGLVLMVRTFLCRKFKLKGFYFPRHRQRQSNGTSGTDYLHGTAVVKRRCLIFLKSPAVYILSPALDEL